MTLNNIYSAGYIFVDSIPTILNGTDQIIENELGSWFFETIIIQTIPYASVFLILFIVLAVTRIISVWVAILLIVLLLVVIVLCVFWIKENLTTAASNLSTQLTNRVNDNWFTNARNIETQINTALSVNVDTLACTGSRCGFEPNPLFPGCQPAVSPFCSGCVRPSLFCGDTGDGASAEILQVRNSYNDSRIKLDSPEDIMTLNTKYIEEIAKYIRPSNCTNCIGLR
ncbi:MAG: hypothetical protein ABIQ41_05380 [Gemmatimonadales bacterium]